MYLPSLYARAYQSVSFGTSASLWWLRLTVIRPAVFSAVIVYRLAQTSRNARSTTIVSCSHRDVVERRLTHRYPEQSHYQCPIRTHSSDHLHSQRNASVDALADVEYDAHLVRVAAPRPFGHRALHAGSPLPLPLLWELVARCDLGLVAMPVRLG